MPAALNIGVNGTRTHMAYIIVLVAFVAFLERVEAVDLGSGSLHYLKVRPCEAST